MSSNHRPSSSSDEQLAEFAVFRDDAVFLDSPVSTNETSRYAQTDELDVSDFEWLAAQLMLSEVTPAEDMPAEVVKQIKQIPDLGPEPASPRDLPDESADSVTRPSSQQGTGTSWGLWAAVAASLLIGIGLDRFVLNRPGGMVSDQQDPAAQLAALEAMPDTVEVNWSPQDGTVGEGVSGRVIWNDRLDKGFMTFAGLAPNDPRIEQYQLWIFDEKRNPETPVDGGVFNIDDSKSVLDTGEVIVPIDARLSIAKATLFAITVEDPGGVVVSDRSRLPLLASVDP